MSIVTTGPMGRLVLAANLWNENHRVGCQVRVERDDGSTVDTRTRSEAFVMSGRVMVMLEGISGAYLLSRCTALRFEKL